MATVFLGSEALHRREVTMGQLRWNYRAIYPNVYMPRIAADSLYANTVGAWLWSGWRAPITGRAASAIHECEWHHVKVIAGDRPRDILQRVARAWDSRRDSGHCR